MVVYAMAGESGSANDANLNIESITCTKGCKQIEAATQYGAAHLMQITAAKRSKPDKARDKTKEGV